MSSVLLSLGGSAESAVSVIRAKCASLWIASKLSTACGGASRWKGMALEECTGTMDVLGVRAVLDMVCAAGGWERV